MRFVALRFVALIPGLVSGLDSLSLSLSRTHNTLSLPRLHSPGGSALASDLMWREIRALSREKPVVASMVDVAASGGYYIRWVGGCR